MPKYDVTIIGSGPGGYVAALRCAQLGLKTALIEKYPSLGGTCLNVGCIPSKALLDSTHHFQEAQTHFAEHGIETGKLKVNMGQMIKRKEKVVKQTCDGVAFLMKKHKVDVHRGVGSFVNKNKIAVKPDKGKAKNLETDKVIIATGSKPATLPKVKIDKKRVITSTEALNLRSVPKEVVVIGGGYIGLEMGSVFARVGAKVTVVEYMDRLIPNMDKDLGRTLQRSLKKLGITFKLSHKVTEVKASGKSATVKAEDKNGKKQSFKADYCLVAVGRKPYTEGLALDKAGLQTDDQGRIPVNAQLQTGTDNIYAIGDVIRGPMLAHKAEDEGVLVAEQLAGGKPHMDYNLIPGVVYTWPEVAAVGKTEDALKEEKVPYKTGKFPFQASGRARASMDTEGFIKVLAHKDSDEILGVHMIGPRIADLVIEAVVAMEYRASAEDVARMCHPHPTYTEAFKEACLAATDDRALHV